MSRDFLKVELVIQQDREQRDSVKGKDTPFRVEFRYHRGMKCWRYYETLDAARIATDIKPGYGPTGRAVFEYPLSHQIQERGPRGGWRAYHGTP